VPCRLLFPPVSKPSPSSEQGSTPAAGRRNAAMLCEALAAGERLDLVEYAVPYLLN
jgi:hypothetical protein